MFGFSGPIGHVLRALGRVPDLVLIFPQGDLREALFKGVGQDLGFDFRAVDSGFSFFHFLFLSVLEFRAMIRAPGKRSLDLPGQKQDDPEEDAPAGDHSQNDDD